MALAPDLYGVRVYVRPYPMVSVQKRWHRRRRLDKKYRKLYGFIQKRGKYNPREVMISGLNVYMYPEGKAALGTHIAELEARIFDENRRQRLTHYGLSAPLYSPTESEYVRGF